MKVRTFWNSLSNSLLISVLTVVLSIVIHSLMGYAVGRNKAHSKGYNLVYLYIVSGMFVPFAILMMPLVKQTAQMGLNNRFGVILLYVVFYMPMNVLLYTGYLKNIPIALEEAACVDGASTWTTYWKIVFPIMRPMHATVAVLTALGTWNDVMTPLVIMSGGEQNTLPLAQLTFQTQFGTNYNLAFASYLLALLPILIFYLICQKQILNGVVNGASKIKRKGTSNMAIILMSRTRHLQYILSTPLIRCRSILMVFSYIYTMEERPKAAWTIFCKNRTEDFPETCMMREMTEPILWMCSRRNFQHGEQEITEAQR